jgi:hypothetical protein
MKKQVIKWLLRFICIILFTVVSLIVIVLNPGLLYANRTIHQNYIVYHSAQLESETISRIDEANELLKSSELSDSNYKIDICLNDSSIYPTLMRWLRGSAFAWGFYDKVVLQGDADFKENFVELNGYKWNATQLIAHEATHCLQYNRFGFWKTNPAANLPLWKTEGFPEYVARQNSDQKNLIFNIARLIETEQKENKGWINFADNTGTVIPYYKNWLLVQYCIDVKKMSYQQILDDDVKEENVREEMMCWYQNQSNG